MTSKGNEDVLSASQVLVQHLCTKCPERAEYRSIVAKVKEIWLQSCLIGWVNAEDSVFQEFLIVSKE